MAGNDEVIQLLREMRTNASGKKETVAWLGIAIGILSGFISFMAGNAVMGERVVISLSRKRCRSRFMPESRKSIGTQTKRFRNCGPVLLHSRLSWRKYARI